MYVTPTLWIMKGLPVTEPANSKLDTNTPHSARLWNYWLGGKDNFQPDREAGDAIAGMLPSIVTLAQEDRKFLRRSVQHMVRDGGIRQILDIGTGLPTANNTHEVAQAVAPETKVVYVDNDPLVLVHARALLAGTPEGRRSTSRPTSTIPRRFYAPLRTPLISPSRSR